MFQVNSKNSNSNKELVQGTDTRYGRVYMMGNYTRKALIAITFIIDIKLTSVTRHHR